MLCLISPEKYMLNFFEMSILWKIGFAGAISLPLSSAVCIYFWSLNGWKNHPIWKRLRAAVSGEWRGDSIASAINTEIRRPTVFSSGHYSQKVSRISLYYELSKCSVVNAFIIQQIYVTENWIMKVGTYNLDVVHQMNCVLSLHACDEFELSESSPHGAQYLQIDIRPVNNAVKPFKIRYVLSLHQSHLYNAQYQLVYCIIHQSFTPILLEVTWMHNILVD